MEETLDSQVEYPQEVVEEAEEEVSLLQYPHNKQLLIQETNLLAIHHSYSQETARNQKLSRRIAREWLDLMEFDFEIRHILGKANSRADALSRRPDYDQGMHDNKNIIVLPEEVFIQAVMIANKEEEQDKGILRPWVDPHKLKSINSVWYKEGRRVITGSIEAKCTIIKTRHDPPIYGHPEISKMTQLVEQDYWWPKMKLDIMDYIKGCAECQ